MRRTPPAVFALDLNCAIYHCVRKVQKVKPYNPTIHAEWERDLQTAVIAYIRQMVRHVAPTEKILIAVDGVAPMAKIKQQRCRRFKSALQAEQEARIRAEALNATYVPTPRWDTNAITPGTTFMAGLASALRTYAATAPRMIVVSPADEPGEGEQKIMAWARAHKPASMVVYGLDADLIVLALWATATLPTAVDLFREETEFNGAVKTDATEEEQFLYLDTAHLATVLHTAHGRPGQSKQAFLTDFVALMNLLGNDFVPHGMALKIRDDGVTKLLEIARTLSTPVVSQTATGVWGYNPATLTAIFRVLAGEEERSILRNVKKKLEARPGSTPSKSPEDRALALFNDLPVTWAAESVLVDSVAVAGYEHPQRVLKRNWTAIYDREALGCASPVHAAEVYLQTLAWTLAYYSGAHIDMHAYYPWLLPPRHATILKALEGKTALTTPEKPRIPLKPLEQLAMVLPESSFHLLPSEYRRLLSAFPVYWPTAWGTYSFGRRFLWECEPLIPLVPPSEIRTMVETVLEME